MNISTRILNRQLVRVLLAGMLLSSAFVTDMFADVTIKIGGNVYGGGKDGAVGTSHTSSTTTKETPKEEVTITDNSGTPVKVTEVVVNAGTIKDGSTNGKIFGGGMNGRAYGGTYVTVNGGEMNMVFGAGDGSGAVVFGHDTVLIKNGTINNNVYGGGNEADLIGTTTVTRQGGTIPDVTPRNADYDGKVDGYQTATADLSKDADDNYWIDINGDGVADYPVLWKNIDDDDKLEGIVDKNKDGELTPEDNFDGDGKDYKGNDNDYDVVLYIVEDANGDIQWVELEKDAPSVPIIPVVETSIEFSAEVSEWYDDYDAAIAISSNNE